MKGPERFWSPDYIQFLRDGILVEHQDVTQDEATRTQFKSGRPMFGASFPKPAGLIDSQEATKDVRTGMPALSKGRQQTSTNAALTLSPRSGTSLTFF
jgi:hypothetical protein